MPDDKYHLVKIGTSPRWYVQWSEGGRSKRRSTGCTDDQEAAGFLRAFVLALETTPSFDLTISDALIFYRTNKQVHSTETADLITARLKAFFGATPLENGGPAAQMQYVESRRGDGVSDETIRRELAVISAAYKYTRKFKELRFVPEVISLPASPAKERWLSRQEASVILRHFRTGWTPRPPAARKKHSSAHVRSKTRHLLIFTRLALSTGARSSAIFDLTWDRVDLERNTVDFVDPGQPRTNKRRVVAAIGEPTVRMLRAAKRKARTAYVIEWRGERVGRIARAFRSHMVKLEMSDVTPHTLRHTFATWVARKGVPLHDLGGAMGQSIVSTTARYAKHHPDNLRKVFDAARRK